MKQKTNKQTESVQNMYFDAAYSMICALTIAASGGRVIKDMVAIDNAVYMVLATMITAAGVAGFGIDALGNYATARVLQMEMRKRQKNLEQQIAEKAKQNMK